MAQARKWLKAHGLKTALEAITDGELMKTEAHTPSHEEIRNLIQKELDKNYPTSNSMYSTGRFWVNQVWDDKVLVKKSWSNEEDDDPNWALVDYTVDEGGDTSTPTVGLGELVPVQIQAVPTNGGEGIVIDEAGRRNSSTDSGKINAAMQALMSLVDEGDVEPDTISLMRRIVNADSMKPLDAQQKKEGLEGEDQDDQDIIAESWSSLPGETFAEAFSSALSEVEVDYENRILKNVVILGSVSTNGRKYPVETQRKARSLFEGIKAYVNHPKLNEMKEPRDVRDLIGEHKNVRVVGDKTISDLHLLDNAVVRDVVLPVAEQKPHLVGNSIVAHGKMIKEDDGTYTVDQILAARSVDIVTEPATTKSLFAEGKQVSTEEEMDFKDLTLETLRKERPDLFEAVSAALTVELETKTSREVEAKALKDKLTTLETRVTEQEASILERDKKIVTHELERAKAQKDTLVEGLFKTAKIPDRIKYVEKDGVKSINPHFRPLLERCQEETEMKELIRTWEETYRQGPISEEKHINFGGSDKISDGDIEHLHQAFVS